MSKQQRASLLVSGGINSKLNHKRYSNDLERWCLALQARRFDCAVCYADGSGLGISGARIRSGERSDIEDELSLLCGLSEDDLAIVLVSNHGNAKGFCTWGQDCVSPDDLAQSLDRCPATKIIILGQCNSGIFSSMKLAKTIVITACGPAELSWACAHPPGPKAYDEFLFRLSESLVPATPTTSPAAAKAPLSLHSAFEMAAAEDRRPETPTITDADDLSKSLFL